MALDEWYEFDPPRGVLRSEAGQELTLVGAESSDQLCADPVVLLFEVATSRGPEG